MNSDQALAGTLIKAGRAPDGRKGRRGGEAGPGGGEVGAAPIRWRFSPADAVSLLNMVMGAAAIVMVLIPEVSYPAGWPDGITMASSLIIAALILDGIDGAVARRFGGSPLGLVTDSAADFVSFCLAPGALVAAAYWTTSDDAIGSVNVLCLFVALLFAGAGLKRLVDFTRKGHRKASFTGLATPAAALTAVVMVHLLPRGSDILEGLPDPTIQLAILGLTASLMVAPLQYPRVRGWVGVAFALSMFCGLFYLVLRKTIFPLPEAELYPQYNVLRFLALAIVLLYVIGGAVYAAMGKRRRRRAGRRLIRP